MYCLEIVEIWNEDRKTIAKFMKSQFTGKTNIQISLNNGNLFENLHDMLSSYVLYVFQKCSWAVTRI